MRAGFAGQADSLWRPLRRRALRIARPARVDMRWRNPWFFARLRLFGWYVRFTAVLPGRHRWSPVAPRRLVPMSGSSGNASLGYRRTNALQAASSLPSPRPGTGRRTMVPVPVAQVPGEGYRDAGSTNDRDTASLLKLEGDRQPRQGQRQRRRWGPKTRCSPLRTLQRSVLRSASSFLRQGLPTTRALVLAWEFWIAVTGLGEEIRVVH